MHTVSNYGGYTAQLGGASAVRVGAGAGVPFLIRLGSDGIG